MQVRQWNEIRGGGATVGAEVLRRVYGMYDVGRVGLSRDYIDITNIEIVKTYTHLKAIY